MVKVAKPTVKKGKLKSQTWLSSTGSLLVALASVATLLLENQEAVTAALVSIIPAPYVALAQPALALAFGLLAFYFKRKTDEGREKAALSGEQIEGWF